MAIQHFIRKIRGQSVEEPVQDDLTPEQLALVGEWKRSLAELTPAQIDDIFERSLKGHEDELREALEESDAYRAERRRARGGG